MIDIVVSQQQYEQLREDGSLMLERKTASRSKPKHKYSEKPKHGPLEITNPSSDFNTGCGIKFGDARNIRWRAEREKGKPKPPIRGGIAVTALSVAYCQTTGLWEVTFVKQAALVGARFLASAAGYTSNRDASIDPDAEVMYDPEVERIMHDEQEAMREARRAKAKKKIDLPPPPTETLSDAERQRRIDAISDELAA